MDIITHVMDISSDQQSLPDKIYLELLEAIQNNDEQLFGQTLAAAIDMKFDMNHHPRYTRNAPSYNNLVIEAASVGNVKMVQALIDNGADMRVGKYSTPCLAVESAARNGHLDVIKLLHRYAPGCIFGGSPFWAASSNYQFDVVDYFLSQGVTINYFNVCEDLIEDSENMEKSYKMFVRIWSHISHKWTNGCVQECQGRGIDSDRINDKDVKPRPDILDFIKSQLDKDAFMKLAEDYKSAVNSDDTRIENTFKVCWPGAITSLQEKKEIFVYCCAVIPVNHNGQKGRQTKEKLMVLVNDEDISKMFCGIFPAESMEIESSKVDRVEKWIEETGDISKDKMYSPILITDVHICDLPLSNKILGIAQFREIIDSDHPKALGVFEHYHKQVRSVSLLMKLQEYAQQKKKQDVLNVIMKRKDALFEHYQKTQKMDTIETEGFS